jgi:hypothetical protein
MCTCELFRLAPLWNGWRYTGYLWCRICTRVFNMGLSAPN